MKKIISYSIIFVLIPLTAIIGAFYGDRSYALVSAIIALLSCVPFLLSYESGKVSTTEIVILAVMTALTAVSRFAFSVTPHFKPITAIVVICGMYMGSRAGFVCGSLSAVVSNMYFGQGPWTPIQMIAWGIIGFVAGLIPKKLEKNPVLISVYGAFSGVLFSLLMDLWSTIAYSDGFTIAKYIAALTASVPITGIYVISNIVFLFILGKPIGNVITRVKNKYAN